MFIKLNSCMGHMLINIYSIVSCYGSSGEYTTIYTRDNKLHKTTESIEDIQLKINNLNKVLK